MTPAELGFLLKVFNDYFSKIDHRNDSLKDLLKKELRNV